MISRRSTLACLAATAGSLPGRQMTLREAAARRGLLFGSAVTRRDLQNATYAALVARECSLITPGIEAKWGYTEPRQDEFHLTDLDQIVAFAKARSLALHMHNLVWAVGLPKWTIAALNQSQGHMILKRHIAMLAGRYRGQVFAWDVVNEPIDPRWPADPNGLCTTPWRRSLGPGFIEEALEDTHVADPSALLFINDDDLEYDLPDRALKRRQYLVLVESLLRRNIPLHGIGLELHFKPWMPFNDAVYRAFLHELAQLGLTIHITEFDVNDSRLPAEISVRDMCVAACAERILNIALDEAATRSLTTWGLSDAMSWLQHDQIGRRVDGLPARPLPYDSEMRAKPLRAAILNALLHARHRPPLLPRPNSSIDHHTP